MTDDINPYAAPYSAALPPDDERQAALRKLRGPSLGLLVLAVSYAVLGTLALALLTAIWIMVVFRFGWEASETHDFAPELSDFAMTISLGISGVIAYGARAMRRGKHYRLAVLSAILACVPFASPWIWLGIPFGIWALIVLRQPAVRAAFASSDHTSAASNPI